MHWVDEELAVPDILPAEADGVYSPRTSATLEACKESTLSEKVQRYHFCAFFVAEHGIRHLLPPDANLTSMMHLLADGLCKMVSSSIWFRLQLHLKVRHTLRRRARRQVQTRVKHGEMLDSWLTFWCAAETKIQQSFRQQLQSPITLQEKLRGHRGTIARAITPVADSLKVQVVWELYWILRAQYTHRLKIHWQRLLALLQQRKAILQRRSLKMTSSATVDIWQGEALSLRAVNAAIFVQLLQEPKFQYVAGREIKAAELLRLANANLVAGCWVSVADSPLGTHRCPTLLAFLSSPLLTEPQWLRSRFLQTTTVIPPCTWVPAKRSQEGGSVSPTSLSGGRRRLSRLVCEVQNPSHCRDVDVETPIIFCELLDESPRGSPLLPPSPSALATPPRLSSSLLQAPGGSTPPGLFGRRCRSISIDCSPSPSLRRPSDAAVRRPSDACVRRSSILSPRSQESSPRAPPRPLYNHLFKQQQPEVTAIYPRLPTPTRSPTKEPLCVIHRRPPHSPRASRTASSPTATDLSCSLPTIRRRHC